MARDLALPHEQDRNLEHVAPFEDGVVAHVLLDDRRGEGRRDPLQERLHVLAEVAVRLADESEDEGHGPQPALGASASGRRTQGRSPAPTTTSTIASWTRRPVRSGWMPSHGISGKATGRGARKPAATSS